ncbi:MAG: hypothetical protein ACRDOJ_12175 [Nocardioidaceae bacterium]
MTDRARDSHAGAGSVDEVAALQATVEIHQLSLNRLSAEVRQLTDRLTQQDAHAANTMEAADAGADASKEDGNDDKPAPWCWRHLPDRQASALWRELADWLTWLHTRYPLAESLPSCWWRHPDVVEEITAAHAAWKAAYTSTGASPYGPGEWHERWLPGLEHRLATRWKTGRCTEAHQDRGTAAYGRAVDDPDAFTQQTKPSAEDSHSAPDVVPMTEITDTVANGEAEVIGADLGDPLYWQGRFWQLTADADGYGQVTDPDQLRVLRQARRRLRLAHAPKTADDGSEGGADGAEGGGAS